MKRFISMLLVVVLALSCLSVTAFAAYPGDTVTVTFTATSNPDPGFATYTATINYDSSVLTLTGIQQGGLSSGVFMPNVAGNKAGFMNGTNITGTGTLFTATFTIKEGAAAGTYPVTASMAGVADASGAASALAVSGGSVTVEKAACTHANTKTETVDATCTTDGAIKTVCADCGETIKSEPIAATGHSYGEWTVTTAPTCTEAGVESQTCSVCGDVATREIAATGHAWGEETVVKEPTCTETGLKNQTCSICGETQNAVEIPALGHTCEEWTVTKAATCEEAGEKIGTCSVCGEALTEVIPALGHNYNWVVITEPTATKEGLKQKVCANCGEIVDEAAIPALGTDEELDDVPYTGDVTNQIVLIIVAVFAVFSAAMVTYKRKAVK